MSVTISTDVLVLGSGPGGYTAAFRAADLGKKVTLVERHATLGGVCLNVGCIPSKALLHAAKIITEAAGASHIGVGFTAPQVDIGKLRHWISQGVVGKLVTGLNSLAKQRGITIVHGAGQFTSQTQIAVVASNETMLINFQHAIIAAGSHSAKLSGMPDDARILDSTSALHLDSIPGRLLVVGGGIIGLEMGTVYEALGSKVDIVEFSSGLIPGCDADLVRPLQKRMQSRFGKIMLATKVEKILPKSEGLHVTFSGDNAPEKSVMYDGVLVAIGRRPNGSKVGAEKAGVTVDERGFIPVDLQMRTNVPHIFAVGDIVGEPMLAHKATHQGKVAAEVICGHKVEFAPGAIPAVAYTDPEIAWAGLSEGSAKARGIAIDTSVFPWTASGRALSIGRTEGFTKLIFSRETGRLVGAGIVGPGAGDLIAAAVLAIETGADGFDLGLTIHPHPTLSETIGLAAEVATGTITDIMPKKPIYTNSK